MTNTARPSPIAWLIAPAGLLFVLFFVMPFAVMTAMSFYSGNPVTNPNAFLTTRHYERFILDTAGIFHEALWSTLRIGLVTTIVSLLIGYPLAHWMARMQSRLGHALVLMAVIAPMLTGIVVRTFAWMTILQDKGVINTTLMQWGLIEKPLPLMYNEFGTIVALVHIYVPFMVLTLTGVIGRIDERLEQAARSLGAGRLRAFVEGDAAAQPARHSGRLAAGLRPVDQRLRDALADGRHQRTDPAHADRPAGRHQLQSELRGCARRHPAAGLAGHRRRLQPHSGTAVGREGDGMSVARNRRPFDAGRAAYLALNALLLAFLLLPIVIVLVFALNPTPYISFPPVGVSLRWFEKFFTSAEFMNALWLSLWVATVVLVLSIVIGAACALAWRAATCRGVRC